MRSATAKGKTARKAKQEYMSDTDFAELELGFKQALDYHRGNRKGYRVTKRPLPPPPKERSAAAIAKLRHRLQYSQTMFAQLINVSPKTVQAWEQGTRKPDSAALKLLAVADRHPEALLDVE